MRASSLARLVAVAVALAAAPAGCGGKIAPDGAASFAPTATAPEPRPPQPTPSGPTAPPPHAADRDVAAACAAVCDHVARCGSDRPDCIETCFSDARSSSCGDATAAYFTCFADRLADDCAALPPACEDVWCAYARCKGQSLAPYCR